MKVKVEETGKPVLIPMCDMEPGQMAVVVDDMAGDNNRDSIILRTEKAIADFMDPLLDWEIDCEFKVRILPKGTKIEITA
jgi:hypothetical protein